MQKKASEILGVRLARLYELARIRKIPTVRLGAKQLRWDEEVLSEWAKRGGSIEEDQVGGDKVRDDDT